MAPNTNAPNFAAMLEKITTDPGTLSAAYSQFWNYSIGNQISAMFQCAARGIPLGPIAPFNTWKKLGRHVRKGERAIELCMPIQRRRVVETTDDAGNATTEAATWTQFVYKRHWFVLAQTDGQPFEPPAPPTWDKARALRALDITEIAFDLMDGNCQGFARGRHIAVSPVAGNPFKTLAHELAHVVIGHTAEAEMRDDERTPRNLRELEAEATAMLVCAALGLPGIAESRAYCQHWYGQGHPVPEASARKILKAADQILRAGRQEQPTDGAESALDDSHDRPIDG